MFSNLRAELGRKGWSLRKLSEQANIPYDSLRNKMSGRTEFTWSEMFRIKYCLSPDILLDILFATDDQKTA